MAKKTEVETTVVETTEQEPTELETIQAEMIELTRVMDGLKRRNAEEFQKKYKRLMWLANRRDELQK